jgi:hypothetical protein
LLPFDFKYPHNTDRATVKFPRVISSPQTNLKSSNKPDLVGMGAASSIPPQYLLKDQMGKKTLLALCKEKRINFKQDAEGMFLDVCDENERVTRMQLSWAASKFQDNGKAGDYLVRQKAAMRYGALNALKAAHSAVQQANAAEEVADLVAFVVPRNQASSQAALAAVEAAHAASQTGVEATLKLVDSMLRRQALDFIQKLAIQQLGETAPLVNIDLLETHRLELLEPGNSNELVLQISLTIKAIHDAVLDFNKRMRKAVGDIGEEEAPFVPFEMLQFRIEGHVVETTDSKFEELLDNSQRMAEAVISQAANDGVPKTFLHPQGCGIEEPAANPSESMRLEVHIMQEGEFEAYMKLRFDFYDSDCSGKLEETEVRCLARDLGKTEEETNEFLHTMAGRHHGEEVREGVGEGAGSNSVNQHEQNSSEDDEGFQIEASADFQTLLDWAQRADAC